MSEQNKMEDLIDSIHKIMEDNGGGHALLIAWDTYIINCYNDLERQLAERNQSHLELHQDYNSKYNECEELKSQLAELKQSYKELLAVVDNNWLDRDFFEDDEEFYQKFKNKLKEQGE